jgi:hypothetical protein
VHTSGHSSNLTERLFTQSLKQIIHGAKADPHVVRQFVNRHFSHQVKDFQGKIFEKAFSDAYSLDCPGGRDAWD